MAKGIEYQAEICGQLWDVDADFNFSYYLVKAPNGTFVRSDSNLESPILGLLYENTTVEAKKQEGNRIQISRPIEGWVSLKSKKGYSLLELISKRHPPIKKFSHYQSERFSDESRHPVASEKKRRASTTAKKKRHIIYDKYRIICSRGCFVRKDLSLESQKIGLLYQNTVVAVRTKVGSRLQIVAPMEGWISLKNRRGYVLLESLSNITSHKLFEKEIKPHGDKKTRMYSVELSRIAVVVPRYEPGSNFIKIKNTVGYFR